MTERKEMDKCPYCNSGNIDFIDTEYESDWDWKRKMPITFILRTNKCCDCNKQFRQLETYGLQGYIIQDEDGEDIYCE